MANDGKYDMPGEMRAFAEKGLEQARTAFDAFVTAAQQAATATQTQVMRPSPAHASSASWRCASPSGTSPRPSNSRRS